MLHKVTPQYKKVMDAVVEFTHDQISLKAFVKKIKDSEPNVFEEILCSYPKPCGMRMNGRCDLAEPCRKYVPTKRRK